AITSRSAATATSFRSRPSGFLTHRVSDGNTAFPGVSGDVPVASAIDDTTSKNNLRKIIGKESMRSPPRKIVRLHH
ncbi:MAG TPA: hypothetical protein VJ818_03045, partial [Actinomycetota bacterium]|nr:hypothetical protein [Actinomycetota bacterium]